jgi:hypothetical protein
MQTPHQQQLLQLAAVAVVVVVVPLLFSASVGPVAVAVAAVQTHHQLRLQPLLMLYAVVHQVLLQLVHTQQGPSAVAAG